MDSLIKLVILDVDGCLTDGKIYDRDHNVIGKVFNDLDFTSIKKFKALKIDVCFLTSDEFNIGLSKKRLVDFWNGKINGKIDKAAVYEKIKIHYGVKDNEISSLGDDVFDIPVLSRSIWSFCPSNSPNSVKEETTHILKGRSGENLVSEMFDWLVYKELIQEPSIEELIRIDSEESK